MSGDALALMARYHVWATARLLDAVAVVPDPDYRRDCGLFFGSIHGTLNHLLLTDSTIWQQRFEQRAITSLALDAEMDGNRESLDARLREAVARWPALIAGMDEATLGGELHYVMTTGEPRALPMTAALLHVFNHATHHRGQVTAGLSMLGHSYQAIDLPLMLF